MCDYSLMSFPNRLAAAGEELVVHRFSSGSLGLASPADLERNNRPPILHRSLWAVLHDWFTSAEPWQAPAVCIPPTARLILHDISERFQSEYRVRPEEEVTFQQLSAEAHTYRDALRFQNGRTVKLQELQEGQRVTVIDLGGTEAGENDAIEAQTLHGR